MELRVSPETTQSLTSEQILKRTAGMGPREKALWIFRNTPIRHRWDPAHGAFTVASLSTPGAVRAITYREVFRTTYRGRRVALRVPVCSCPASGSCWHLHLRELESGDDQLDGVA